MSWTQFSGEEFEFCIVRFSLICISFFITCVVLGSIWRAFDAFPSPCFALTRWQSICLTCRLSCDEGGFVRSLAALVYFDLSCHGLRNLWVYFLAKLVLVACVQVRRAFFRNVFLVCWRFLLLVSGLIYCLQVDIWEIAVIYTVHLSPLTRALWKTSHWLCLRDLNLWLVAFCRNIDW